MFGTNGEDLKSLMISAHAEAMEAHSEPFLAVCQLIARTNSLR